MTFSLQGTGLACQREVAIDLRRNDQRLANCSASVTQQDQG